jgi:hypothetical protein
MLMPPHGILRIKLNLNALTLRIRFQYMMALNIGSLKMEEKSSLDSRATRVIQIN